MKNKLSIGRIFAVGLLFAVISQILHTLGAWLTMPYYLLEEYFPVWSKVMMPGAGAPPVSFYVYSLLFALISGLLFALVYAVVKNSVPGKTSAKKGLIYGLLVFLIAGIPMTLNLYLLINLPGMLIFEWAVEALIIYLVSGLIVAKIIK